MSIDFWINIGILFGAWLPFFYYVKRKENAKHKISEQKIGNLNIQFEKHKRIIVVLKMRIIGLEKINEETIKNLKETIGKIEKSIESINKKIDLLSKEKD
jgi:hypothetical protein